LKHPAHIFSPIINDNLAGLVNEKGSYALIGKMGQNGFLFNMSDLANKGITW